MNPSEFRSSRKFADTRFGRIAYVERGTGRAAVFLHGLPLCGYEWRDVIEDLAPVRRCIALDLMGLGYTEVAPERDISFAEQARMIGAFLDALKIDAVDLVGNDTGGGIAQIFAATHPRRLRTLTLTNCEVHDLWPNDLLAGFYQGVDAGVVPDAMKQMLSDNRRARAELGALVYENADVFTPEVVEVYLAPIVASDARIAQFRRLSDWRTNRAALIAAAPELRASSIPTQVIWGDGDVVFDTDRSLAWLRANLGGLQKTILCPRGKLFFPEEHPRLVSVSLREFWRHDTAEIMRRFNDAFQRHDPTVFPDIVGDDCILENTGPAPDGARHVGGKACIELWRGIATAQGISFDLENTIVIDDRAIILWRLRRSDGGSVRGVNLMRVRDGRIVEGLGYIKA
jgi:pimeloyl-ACP methyl ester carboxylesterase